MLGKRSSSPVWLGFRRFLPQAVLGVVAACASLFGLLGPRQLHELTTVFIFAIVATGLHFLYRYGGQLSVAHGSLWGIGAYGSATLFQEMGWNFWLGALAAIAMAGIAAAVVGYPSLRVHGHYFLIVTFAFAEMFRLAMSNVRGITGGTTGLSVTTRPEAPWPFSFADRTGWYWVALICLLTSMAAVEIVGQTNFGRRLTAVGENEDLAISVGINASRIKVLGFVISGMVAGLAGILWAFNQRFIAPGQFGAFAGIDFILILMLGGAYHIFGPVVGALVIVYLREILGLSPTQNEIALGVILILVILFLPNGLSVNIGQGMRLLIGRLCHHPWVSSWLPQPARRGPGSDPVTSGARPECPEAIGSAGEDLRLERTNSPVAEVVEQRRASPGEARTVDREGDARW